MDLPKRPLFKAASLPGWTPIIPFNPESPMTETSQFLANRLLAEGEKSIAFFQELSPQNWEQEIYTEGTHWRPQQILAHFVATEISLYRLVENILAGGSGTPEDFNIDSYNERKVAELQQANVPQLLESFRTNRKKTADLVAGLTGSELEKKGRHPFLGVVQLPEIIKIIYRHNQIHLREIRKNLNQSA